MRLILKLTTCLLFSVTAYSQQSLSIQDINIPSGLSTDTNPYEFSGLAKWNNMILLIPTLKKPHKECALYAISESDIAANLKNPNARVSYQTIEIDTASFKKYISGIGGYDGIEAAVVVDSAIYFSVEVDGARNKSNCRIARGHINTENIYKTTVVIDTFININRNVFPATEKINNNSGFESLAYLPAENKLVAFFEDRDYRSRHYYYKIDLTLRKSSLFVLNQSVEERLADICLYKKKVLFGISSRYDGNDKSRSTLVKIDISKNLMMEMGELCLNNCPDNWEGIIRFGDGILLVSDNKYGSNKAVKSRLVYCELPE